MITFHSIMTLISFLAFILLVVWAWGGSRKEEFESMARMALDDDKPVADEDKRGANKDV